MEIVDCTANDDENISTPKTGTDSKLLEFGDRLS
jgi:hypothetical protein